MMPIAAMRLRSVAGAPGAVAYRYWRILITDNAGDTGYTAIQEMELRIGGVDQTSAALAIASAAASSVFSGTGTQPASNGFDNDFTDINNAWATATGASYPHWLRWDFGASPKAIEHFAIWPQNRSDLVSRSPKNFSLQGSDNATTWTTLKTYVGISAWTAGTGQVFATS